MKLLYAVAWILGIALMGAERPHPKSSFLPSIDFGHRTFTFTVFSF